MFLKNPHTEKVEITVKGSKYEVAPGGIISVSEEVGTIWVATHQFLKEVDAPEIPKEKKDAPEVTNITPADVIKVAEAPKVAAKTAASKGK